MELSYLIIMKSEHKLSFMKHIQPLISELLYNLPNLSGYVVLVVSDHVLKEIQT